MTGIEPATFGFEVTLVFTTGESSMPGFRELLQLDPSALLSALTPSRLKLKADLETRPSFPRIAQLRRIPAPLFPTTPGKTCDTVPPSGGRSRFPGKACSQFFLDGEGLGPVFRHDSSSLQTTRHLGHENRPVHSATRKA